MFLVHFLPPGFLDFTHKIFRYFKGGVYLKISLVVKAGKLHVKQKTKFSDDCGLWCLVSFFSLCYSEDACAVEFQKIHQQCGGQLSVRVNTNSSIFEPFS